MLYLLFAHPQQNETNNLNVIFNQSNYHFHASMENSNTVQFNSFDGNMATQIIITTGKERKNKNIFLLFTIYTLMFTAS